MQINVSDFFLRDFHLTDCLGSMSCNDPHFVHKWMFFGTKFKVGKLREYFWGVKNRLSKSISTHMFFLLMMMIHHDDDDDDDYYYYYCYYYYHDCCYYYHDCCYYYDDCCYWW